jgi:hypothetical protein
MRASSSNELAVPAVLATVIVCAAVLWGFPTQDQAKAISAKLTIDYPLNGSIFPPEKRRLKFSGAIPARLRRIG